MNKIILFVLSLWCINSHSFAQNINIPDANFKAALVANTAINTNADAEIDSLEAQAFTGRIDVSNQNISDITGLASFVNITGFVCFLNQIDTLDLSANTALTYLVCHNNQLRHLNIDFCPNLDTLSCSTNQLTTLNLNNNSNLVLLACQVNQLTALNTSNNSSLTTVFCNNNQLTSLDFSSSLGLIQLNCNTNPLTNLNVGLNTNLTFLECQANQLSSLNLHPNTSSSLRVLWCSGNQLTNLNLDAYSNLINLKCSNNQLNQLNVNNCSALTNLECFSNQIDSLDVSTNILLENLLCSNNQMDYLNLNGATSLKNLDVSNNDLVVLDVSHSLILETLKCTKNIPLLELDVSGNPLLTYLDINGAFIFTPTNLTTLNVQNGNNTNFTYFRASFNVNLACIQVDDVAYSNTNWTNIDQSSSFSTNCNPTSIQELPNSSFKLYPNPTERSLNIEFEQHFVPKHFSILDISGKKIIEQPWISNTISVENLNSGVYILQIYSEKRKMVLQKFIKQ